MKWLAAAAVGLLIGLVMAFIVLVVLYGRMDLYAPVMGIALVLAVLLAIGATEWLLFRRPARHQDDPPRSRP